MLWRRIRPVSTTGRPASAGNLVLEEVFALGSQQGEHDAFGRVINIAVDRRGRIFVADDTQHHIKVFAPDGTFEATTGRQGQGPGEFSAPWNVAVDRADSIFVWDMGEESAASGGPVMENVDLAGLRRQPACRVALRV